MFDFREVITTNQTSMNRLSLISVANDGTTYNAYIGNSANTNEEGTLYIGSSTTNYSMSGNKTVTNDYDKFATFKKINFELPYETQNLSIYKAANNVYFAYMAVDFVENTEEVIKKGAKKISEVTEEVVDNIKNSEFEFTTENVFELVIKVILVLFALAILKIPFYIVEELVTSIFEFGILLIILSIGFFIHFINITESIPQ